MLEKLNATLMYKPWGEKYLTGDLSGWNCISLRNILWESRNINHTLLHGKEDV